MPSGGELVVAGLREYGVDTIFTLSGAHIFPIYDGCRRLGVRLIDTRHEQTATFAAEGLAKLTRSLGVAAVTAGPGVTNTISAVASARDNGSPLLVLGGRAPSFRWGHGSLQEFDHPPLLAPVTKHAATVDSTDAIPDAVAAGAAAALTPHRGPVFLDFGLDALADVAAVETPPARPVAGPPPDPARLAPIVELVDGADRPVLVAGGDVYWAGAWTELAALASRAGLAVFTNGLGRGTIPPDHPNAFSRARSKALAGADLIVVAGTPLDFRLRFGDFGSTPVVHLMDAPELLARHVEPAAAASGDLRAALAALTAAVEERDRSGWLEELRTEEEGRRRTDRELLDSAATPIHPAAIYGALEDVLDDDAVVIGDGGDFVSFAGRFVASHLPGRWMDPGPFGCLGTGLGYAMAARLTHPDRQVVAFMGDGAFGFSGMDFDTLVRHRLPVVVIVGNNGIWGLEKHPMQFLYGYDVAADLQAGCRYDLVVEALGGHGEFVTDRAGIRPAVERAFASGKPALVNVVTDPAVMYPRSANLA